MFVLPLLALAVLAGGLLLPSAPPLLLGVAALALVGAVAAAVHHAEVVAHRVGEPFGTLVLALAVTVIEVALILSMMMAGGASGGADKAALPRDTIFAAVMIICNGVVGLCLLLGGLWHREQRFRIEGTGPGMAALVTLTTLSLVMPTFTTSSPEGTYTTSQLVFVACSSLVLWLVFVFFQTVRHRDYFLTADGDTHAGPPSGIHPAASFGMLLLALVAVVGLAKLLSPGIEAMVTALQAPKAVVGILIAVIVLLPETWAAVRAARANRLQTSFNLAVGSALASIGLTIPAVVAASVWLKLPLMLGLEAKDMALLALTFVVGAITLGSGRTNLMQGAVHLVIFVAFLFLALVP